MVATVTNYLNKTFGTKLFNLSEAYVTGIYAVITRAPRTQPIIILELEFSVHLIIIAN